MALIADLDALDLVVEPHQLTPEEAEETSRFIREYRAKHPLTEEQKREVQAIVERIRQGSRPNDQPPTSGDRAHSTS